MVAILCTVCVALHSSEAIITEMNTDYPGTRIDTGGSYGLSLFRYPISVFLPFIPASSASSLSTGLPDALVTFFDFFPLGIMLAIVNYVRSKRLDPLSVALGVVIIFLGIYISFGFPEAIAKVTLMGKSIPTRTLVIFSFANLILLFHEFSQYCRLGKTASTRSNRKNDIALFGVCLIASVALTVFCEMTDNNFFGNIKLCAVFIILLCAWLFVAFDKKQLFAGLCVVIAVVSGAFVNPIQRGIDVVDDNPLIVQVREIAEENPGAKWVGAVKSRLPLTTWNLLALLSL